MPFDDGTLRIFLNAAGAAKEVHEGAGQLSEFLSYVDGGGTMGNRWLEQLDGKVHSLNEDEGWRETVLSFESLIEEEVALARQKALAEGRAEGREEGRAEGREEESDLNRSLALRLSEAGRQDEFLAAALDPSLKERLLEEFGIAPSPVR